LKISSLSRKSGVSVPTIKFYLREQLIPPGEPTARNQASYNEVHLARLRLIRVLTGVGMMSLASVREVMAAIDDNCLSPHGVYQVLNRALLADRSPQSPPDTGGVAGDLDELINGLGWKIDPAAPGRETLTHVLAALQYLDFESDISVFLPYAQAADQLAAQEVDSMRSGTPAMVVARTVLFEVAFAVMRRMAYEHYMVVRGERETPRTTE